MAMIRRAGWTAAAVTALCLATSMTQARDLPVPPGTLVFDVATGELLGEILRPGDSIRVARGGRGGRGNTRFATSTHQAPREWEPGEEGEDRQIELVLKLIADVGLVGEPARVTAQQRAQGGQVAAQGRVEQQSTQQPAGRHRSGQRVRVAVRGLAAGERRDGRRRRAGRRARAPS